MAIGDEPAATPGESGVRLFAAGLAIALGNPKIMAFYLASPPSVVDLARLMVLGAIRDRRGHRDDPAGDLRGLCAAGHAGSTPIRRAQGDARRRRRGTGGGRRALTQRRVRQATLS